MKKALILFGFIVVLVGCEKQVQENVLDEQKEKHLIKEEFKESKNIKKISAEDKKIYGDFSDNNFKENKGFKNSEKYCIEDICFTYPKGWQVKDIDMTGDRSAKSSGTGFFSVVDAKSGEGDYSKPYILVNDYFLHCPESLDVSLNDCFILVKEDIYGDLYDSGRIEKKYKNIYLPKLKVEALHMDLNEHSISSLYLFNSSKGVFTVTHGNLGEDEKVIVDKFFNNIEEKTVK